MQSVVRYNPRVILIILGVGMLPPLLFLFRDTFITPIDCTPEEMRLQFLSTSLFSVSVTAVLYFGNTLIFNFLQRNFPWSKSPTKRLLIEVPAVIVYTTVAMLALSWGYFNSFDLKVEYKWFMYSNTLIANAIAIVVVLVCEGFFFFMEWRELKLRSEQLEKERVKAEYNSLKAQVNPHFLFNSLNSLLTLVRLDTEKSEQFIIHLSKVYRYVLDNRERLAVELKDELEFADSYAYLHQIRFGKNLRLIKEVDAATLKMFVPPLTLQLLLENAIKHNVISSKKPLTITLKTLPDGRLLVSNNYQPRSDKTASTGLGLNNLSQRYQLLSKKIPKFELTDAAYRALVPLLNQEGVAL